ncbi:MAG TPA: MgtC/SapB family protein [Steroidobacteraceae bacterium]|nr:MgtC/SapB family protein [Steroidobacteraceae bacterium]
MEFTPAHLEMILRLVAALLAGALIGFERSFHGRPAGLRTHVLVCLASSVLMLVTVYEDHWVRTAAVETRLDPTRMAQGIMTGIGFLGAGVIVKEGINVRGLTTAASIWITAGIGVLAGVGLYFPMIVSVILTLLVLSVFRWVEAKAPSRAYYFFDVKYARDGNLSEETMRELLRKLGFSIANFSYRLDGTGEARILRHHMTLQTIDRTAAPRLARYLEENKTVLEFKLSPTGD